MLESLSVKNFALIKEAHIDFKNNLNVLTGETGSGILHLVCVQVKILCEVLMKTQ